MSHKQTRSVLWPLFLVGLPVILALVVGIVLVVDASAQEWNTVDDDAWCEGNDWGSKHCEIRETRLPARSTLKVDGEMNGGISIEGWSREGIEVLARLQVWGKDDDAARELASKIRIETDGTLRATGPRQRGKDGGWSVSYRIRVPHRTHLDLTTHNGGISIERIEGNIRFDALNGGISLTDLAGRVTGSTVNGGLSVLLSGDTWDGDELDVETTNGGVTVRVPEGYSADFWGSTVNGSVVWDMDERVSLSKRSRKVRTSLGDGGAPVRVATVNGGLVVTQE